MIDMTPTEVTRRLRSLSDQSDLARDRRLLAKIDMSPAGVTRRLRKVSELRDLCLWLAAVGRANGLGRRESTAQSLAGNRSTI